MKDKIAHENIRTTFHAPKCSRKEDLIYHYTNKNAAISILSNKNLRLSHIERLNDYQEGKFILDKIFNHLRKEDSEKANRFESLLMDNTYLCSFSRHGNLLSQWRGYGNICIEFDKTKLNSSPRIIKDSNREKLLTAGINIFPCEYHKPNDMHIKEYIDKISDLLNNLPEENIPETQEILLEVGEICFNKKHIGFEEEQEERLFTHLWKKNPSTTEDGKMYIEYLFDPQAITAVIFGPGENQGPYLDKIKNFLQTHPEYEHIELFKSGIPYRD